MLNVFKCDHISFFLFDSSLYLFPNHFTFFKWCACLHCLLDLHCSNPFTWFNPFNINLRLNLCSFTKTYLQPHFALQHYSIVYCICVFVLPMLLILVLTFTPYTILLSFVWIHLTFECMLVNSSLVVHWSLAWHSNSWHKSLKEIFFERLNLVIEVIEVL